MSVLLKIGDKIIQNEVISISENASSIAADRDKSSLFGGKNHLNIDLRDTNPSTISIKDLQNWINDDNTFIVCDRKTGEEIIRYSEYDFIGTLSKQIVERDNAVTIMISIIMYRKSDLNIEEDK